MGAQVHRGEVEVSWEQALAWRMRRQHLLERTTSATSPTGLAALVDRMCGLHAQVMSSVELALWARTEGLTREAVQDALWRQRTLVKLWAMRGTLHVLSAADLGLFLAGLGTYMQTHDRLKDPAMHELAEWVGKALHDKVLTRTELADAVGRLSGSSATGDVIHGSWGSYLKPASFHGRLCFGPSDGQRVRFTHPDTWLPAPHREPPPPAGPAGPADLAGPAGPAGLAGPVAPDADTALATIADRFLNAYGPAAPVDLACWWGTTGARANRMLAALGDRASEVSVDGKPYWMPADQVTDLVATVPPADVVRLLPGFDQWVVCASRRDGSRSRPGPGLPALDPAHRKRIYRLQGWVSPVLVVNGRMEGVWKHQRKGRRLYVEIEPFRRQPRWTRQPIEAEAERLAGFLGGELHLSQSA